MWKLKTTVSLALLLLYVTGTYFVEGAWQIAYLALLFVYGWFHDDLWESLRRKHMRRKYKDTPEKPGCD